MTDLQRLEADKQAELDMLNEFGLSTTEAEAYYNQRRADIQKKSAADRQAALHAESNTYKSATENMMNVLGMGAKQQAAIMIPWEIAEGIHDLAGGAWPPNPVQLLAASQHFVAAKQWADMAGSAGDSSGAGGGYGGSSGMGAAPEGALEMIPGANAAQPQLHKTSVTIDLGRRIAEGGYVQDIEGMFRDTLADVLNQASNNDVHLEFV